MEARLQKDWHDRWTSATDFFKDATHLQPNEVYEFFIKPQYGTDLNRGGHIFWLVLPESRKAVAIFLFPDKGYVFDKTYHTELIREYDNIDLRIIRSFVEIYQNDFRDLCALQFACNISPYLKNNISRRFTNLAIDAFFFSINKAKARPKEGRMVFDDIKYYKNIYYANKYLNIRWNSNDLIMDKENINKSNVPIGFKENAVSFKDYNPFKDIVFI